MMKNPIFRHLTAAAILLATTHVSHGASAFWSFQTLADGSSGAHTFANTVNSGFAFAGTIESFNGGNGATSANTGGQTSYTYDSTVYTGNGTSVSGGSSRTMGWQASSTSTLAGAGFTVSLDTTGLTDLSLSFSVRSATSSASTVGPAPTRFDLIEYSTDGGDTWTNTNLASSFLWTASSSFDARSPVLSFTGITGVENEEDLKLRFVLGNTKLDEASGTIALRIDNLEINAVPEPSILATSALGLLMLARRRR